jgi:preprotein translocase subunit YajC
VLAFAAIWALIVVTLMLAFYFGVFRPQWRHFENDSQQKTDSMFH